MARQMRRQLFIDPSFQKNFIFKFCIIVILSSLLVAGIVLFLTQNSTTVAIEKTKVLVKPTSDFILPSLSVTLLIVTVFSALVVLLLTLIMSHKIAGPIFRLKREIDVMQSGDLSRNFNLRADDQLQPLSRSLSFLTNTFRAKHKELQEDCRGLMQFLEKRDFNISVKDKEELNTKLDVINSKLNYFKV